MQWGKVEICGINTSELKVLKEKEKIELLKQIKDGNKTIKMFMQFLSLSIFAKRFLNSKTIRHNKTPTAKAMIVAVVTKEAISFFCDLTLYDAVHLETINANPLETNVSKTIKTDNAT